jgi:hypothetical protein
MKNLFAFLMAIAISLLLFSCDKDEKESLLDQLTKQDWEQKTGIIDTLDYGSLKMFYRVHFNNDYSYTIIMDYLEVSGNPDPIIVDTIKGTYTFNESEKLISFSMPFDTLYNVDLTATYVYMNKWKIVQLDDQNLTVASINIGNIPYYPALVIGGDKFYLKPIDE